MKPFLQIGTRMKYEDTVIEVVEIKRKTVVFDNGIEVSHKEIEFCYDAERYLADS